MSNPYQPPEGDFPGDDAQFHGGHEGPDYDEAREYWPTCPECGKRLPITCPFCKTTDDLFPLGDTEYWDDDLGGSLVEYQRRLDRKVASRSVLFGEGDTSMPLEDKGCSCHKTGQMPSELYGGTRPELTGGHDCCRHDRNGSPCEKRSGEKHPDDEYDDVGDDYDEMFDGGMDHDENEFEEEDDDDLPERDYDGESLPFVVICPTCSEAFIPSFPGGCRYCHYVWDEAKPLEAEQAVEAHRKPPNPALKEPGGVSPKQIFVVGAILVVALLVLAKLLAN